MVDWWLNSVLSWDAWGSWGAYCLLIINAFFEMRSFWLIAIVLRFRFGNVTFCYWHSSYIVYFCQFPGLQGSSLWFFLVLLAFCFAARSSRARRLAAAAEYWTIWLNLSVVGFSVNSNYRSFSISSILAVEHYFHSKGFQVQESKPKTEGLGCRDSRLESERRLIASVNQNWSGWRSLANLVLAKLSVVSKLHPGSVLLLSF